MSWTHQKELKHEADEGATGQDGHQKRRITALLDSDRADGMKKRGNDHKGKSHDKRDERREEQVVDGLVRIVLRLNLLEEKNVHDQGTNPRQDVEQPADNTNDLSLVAQRARHKVRHDAVLLLITNVPFVLRTSKILRTARHGQRRRVQNLLRHGTGYDF